MNKLFLSLLTLVLALLIPFGVSADWRGDCQGLEKQFPKVTFCQAINTVRNEIDKFQPPEPCVNKNLLTTGFKPGEKATCQGSSGGGSTSPGGSVSTPQSSSSSVLGGEESSGGWGSGN